MEYTTDFGSLADYEKGGVTVINDDPKYYIAVRRSELPLRG